MDREVYVSIDRDKCVGCGECVRVCPSLTLCLEDKKAVICGDRSLSCGHCAAVCPTGAVSVSKLAADYPSFTTFEQDPAWLPHGQFDTAQLVRLMRSRRSCRNYTDQPVDRAVLEDLVAVGATAPSGSNCQMWTFTILPDAPAVQNMATQTVDFFRGLLKTASSGLLRGLLRAVGKPELDNFHRNYAESMTGRIAQWDQGLDRFVYKAPAAIMVGSRAGGSCPMEDAMLATGNMMLAAHAMGLGTCLIGYAVSALGRSGSMRARLGLGADETIHAVMLVGHPDEKYRGLPARFPVTPRYAGS